MKKIVFLSFAALCIICLNSCFSPWKDDEGILLINFGVSGRSFVNLESGEFRNFTNTVILKSTNGNRIERTFSGTAGAVSVPPGVYTVSIKASDNSGVRAFGIHNNTVTIRAGQNVSAGLIMYSAVEVTNENELSAALELLYNGQVVNSNAARHLYVLVGKSFSSEDYFFIDGRVTLVSETDVVINLINDSDCFFSIEGFLSLGAEYMPGTITIKGNREMGAPLFSVHGTLRMYEGVTIQDNGGSAVKVRDEAAFYMYGGKISGNTTDDNGGGVYVDEGGTFNMYGGEISGNTANEKGGGVYIDNANFSKTGGIIYGNDGGSNSNWANASSGTGPGHAVYVDGYNNGLFRNSTAGNNINLYFIDGQPRGDWED
ncbi:MAG: hypothetical protein FWD14_05650 [Treponema sp.]|nr:hypothetical protein [Treponema sp.]